MEKMRCVHCGQLKKKESFPIRKNNKSGYDSACKICRNSMTMEARKNNKMNLNLNPNDTSHLALRGITKQDYCQMYSLLSKLGYNVFGDIHLQFCERHPEIVYKQLTKKDTIKVAPIDCK